MRRGVQESIYDAETFRYLASAAGIFLGLQTVCAQGIVDGKTNLILNGDAESGPAGRRTAKRSRFPREP